MATPSKAMVDLTAAVAANKSVIASAISCIQGIKAALDAAIASLPDESGLKALSDDLQAQDVDLAAAIAANTPTKPPTTGTSNTTLTASPSSANTGDTVTLTAKVSGVGAAPGGQVSFLDGTTSLGTATLDGASTATLDVTFDDSGSHDLTAEYSGDALNTASVSAAESVEVTGAATGGSTDGDGGDGGDTAPPPEEEEPTNP